MKPDVDIADGRRVYELRFDKDSAEGSLFRLGTETETETFEVVAVDTRARFNDRQKQVYDARANIVACTQAMLGTIYHLPPPTFSGSWSRTTYVDAMLLMRVADFYDCVPVMRSHIGTYLQQERVSVGEACRRRPIRMLLFATRVQSDWVALDCAAWLISQDIPAWKETFLPRMEELGSIGDSIIARRKDLQDLMMSIDLTLCHMFCDDADERTYLALNYFRHWLATQAAKRRGNYYGPDYGRLYRDISQGSVPASLKDHGLVSYCGMQPHLLEDALIDRARVVLAQLFEDASEVVAPLLKDVTTLAGEQCEQGTLRCMTIAKEDLPWNSTN